MDALTQWAEHGTGGAAVEEEFWLLGQPPLHHYLSYVKDTVVDGSSIPRSVLVDEWRKANDHYYELEASEAGAADKIEVFDLPRTMSPFAEAVTKDACYRRAFDTLPTRFAMVDLARLVVAQLHVNLTHAKRLRAGLSAAPSQEELFRFCHPLDRRAPPVKIRRLGENRYSFTSDSSDLRFRESVLLHPEQIQDSQRFGPGAAILGLVVGFSSNFLTAVESGNRLLLHNGHHRAFSLLEHGVTHAPCIIQTVTRLDELALVAGRTVQKAPAFYFKAARPPLLKDFLDPKLRKLLRIPRLYQTIDVSFDVQDHAVSD